MLRLTVNKVQYMTLIHNRMHSIKIKNGILHIVAGPYRTVRRQYELKYLCSLITPTVRYKIFLYNHAKIYEIFHRVELQFPGTPTLKYIECYLVTDFFRSMSGCSYISNHFWELGNHPWGRSWTPYNKKPWFRGSSVRCRENIFDVDKGSKLPNQWRYK
jgi:hypothetical protein